MVPTCRAVGDNEERRLMDDQIGIRAVYMRGGTSKGCFFHSEDLPPDPRMRDRALLAIYGSPDARQVDGMGGADPLTSKAAIVGQSSRPDADVDYTFAQVGIHEPQVSYGGNCGNLLSGVGPFAIDEGLIAPVDPITEIRVHNTNTQKVIIARVPVRNGRATVVGECQIAGVPSRGAKIELDFGDCGGTLTGRLLPSGNPRDFISADDGSVEASIVDVATVFVFIRANDLGLKGTEMPAAIEQDTALLGSLQRLRGEVARMLGLVEDPDDAAMVTPSVPRIAIVARPQSYRALSGEEVMVKDVSFVARQLAMGRVHKAFSVTGSICAAIAACIPGTVVHEGVGLSLGNQVIRIGHPSGTTQVLAEVRCDGGEYQVLRAVVDRTARRIMKGLVFVPRTVLDAKEGAWRRVERR